MEIPVDSFMQFFQEKLPKLKTSYNWEIPSIPGFDKSGENGYIANVELKRYFHEIWNSSDNDEKRMTVAEWVVRKWGGIHTIKDKTLREYVDKAKNREIEPPPIAGIASYSKILAIKDLEKYAIYDAKVAACLNALQWNIGKEQKVAFNYVPGRNKITGDVQKKRGFACMDEFKERKLEELGWRRIRRNKTYRYYIDMLRICKREFPKYNLYDFEMALFSNSEEECRKAMESVS